MIRGTKRPVEKSVPTLNVDFSTSIHNRFDIEVIDAATGQVKQTAVAHNTICENLWSYLCKGTAYFNYIFYGSGTGTPSASDTALFNYLGGQAVETANDYTKHDVANGVFSARRMIQLTASTAVGKTITEVGIAYSSDKKTLCTHAMLCDMNGNQISLQKTDTDVVNIYATVFVHYNPNGYDNGSIRMNSANKNSENFLCRFAGVDNNLSYMFCCSGALSYGTNTSSSGFYPVNYFESSGTATYDIAARTMTITMTRIEASDGNIGGIMRIMFRYKSGTSYVTYWLGMSIRPGGSWFPYSEVENESVGIGDGLTSDFNLKFPFAHDVELMVDGVPVTDFTVDYAHNMGVKLTSYFIDWLHAASTVDNHIPLMASPYISYTGTRTFYNPMFEIGMYSIELYKVTSLQVSDDLETWTEIYTSSSASSKTFVIPAEHMHRKYWRGTCNDGHFAHVYSDINTIVLPSDYTGKVLHFATPPGEGAVITANYKSDCFAKDANHVFDVAITFHFNEYEG